MRQQRQDAQHEEARGGVLCVLLYSTALRATKLAVTKPKHESKTRG